MRFHCDHARELFRRALKRAASADGKETWSAGLLTRAAPCSFSLLNGSPIAQVGCDVPASRGRQRDAEAVVMRRVRTL